jgi:hypothetical protein
MQLDKELTMNDFTPRSTADKRPEFSKSGPGRPRAAVAPARNLEAAQRSKMLFDDEAEIDLSDDLGEDETMALLLEQRRWDSNHGLALGSD